MDARVQHVARGSCVLLLHPAVVQLWKRTTPCGAPVPMPFWIECVTAIQTRLCSFSLLCLCPFKKGAILVGLCLLAFAPVHRAATLRLTPR